MKNALGQFVWSSLVIYYKSNNRIVYVIQATSKSTYFHFCVRPVHVESPVILAIFENCESQNILAFFNAQCPRRKVSM